MYDNINFKSRCALTTFECSKCVTLYSLIEIQKIQPNGTTVIEWQSDASKKMLPQYAGIGIKIKHDKNNVLRLQIEMSLHKYWNQRCNGLHLHNYNRFTMTDAKQAYQTLRNEFLTIGIDIQDFTVSNYELSVNLELDAHTTPEMIMCAAQSSAGKEIIQARNYDIHKLYGTHCTKDFRKVTVFYDKAHEVKQKNKKQKINGNTDVPQNLLRCELKYQNKDMRHNKTDLSVLFTDAHIAKVTKRFLDDFYNKLVFAPPQYRPPKYDKNGHLDDAYLTALVYSYYDLTTDVMNENKHLQDCKDLARLQVRKHLDSRKDKERFDRKIKALPLQPPPKRTEIETMYRILVSTELGITIK